MQSYSSYPRGTVFDHLINVLSSKSSPTGLLRKISEIIENMIFSLIAENQENMIFRLSVFTKMLFFMQWFSLANEI